MLRVSSPATMPAPRHRVALVCCLGPFLVTLALFPDVRARAQDPARAQKVLLVGVTGAVDERLVDSVIRTVQDGLRAEPETRFLIFRFDSTGGDPDAAERLTRFIYGDLKGSRTIAFVEDDHLALGLAVLPLFACQDIVLGPDSRVGANFERAAGSAEVEARLASLLREVASSRRRPTVLLDAMLAPSPVDVFQVRFARRVGGVEEEAPVLLSQRDLESLPPDRVAQKRGEPRRVLKAGELLVLSGREAKEDVGLDVAVASSLDQLRSNLKILAPPEDIIDLDRGSSLEAPAGTQSVVDLLNHPFTRFLLLLGGCLGLLLEVKMPGTFLPGSIGLFCFVLYFVSSLFPITGATQGTATLWEILIFGVGLLLIGAEFFLLPGMAIFAVTGAALSIVGLVLAMVPQAGFGLEDQPTVEEAIGILTMGFGAGSLCFLLLLWYLPRSVLLSRRGLFSQATIQAVPTASSALEAQARAQAYLGRSGVALTALRPSGKVRLEDGTELHVVSEKSFVEPGTAVKVVACDGGIVVAPTG